MPVSVTTPCEQAHGLWEEQGRKINRDYPQVSRTLGHQKNARTPTLSLGITVSQASLFLIFNHLPQPPLEHIFGRRNALLSGEPSELVLLGKRSSMKTTWEPYEKHGRLTMRSNLPDTVFAFPKQRHEPLTDARHVSNAVARLDQVIDVSDAERALAFTNIEKAYGADLSETHQ